MKIERNKIKITLMQFCFLLLYIKFKLEVILDIWVDIVNMNEIETTERRSFQEKNCLCSHMMIETLIDQKNSNAI